MHTEHFTFILDTHRSPQEVWDAVCDVPGWWAPDFRGTSKALNDEFEARFGDVHYSRQRVVELEPAKRIVWLVTDSRLSFLEDEREWTGTRIVFDIVEKDGRTQLHFAHEGLQPRVECYDACSEGWSRYLEFSLQRLLDTGKGQPGFPPKSYKTAAGTGGENGADFHISVLVQKPPAEVFRAISDVRGWWSEEVEGSTDTLNAEFSYRYRDVHHCRMRITGLKPYSHVKWLVLENYFKFAEDQGEWLQTEIVFDISEEQGQTRIDFTHKGLLPGHECYEICSNAWTGYIRDSLAALIETGKGAPNPKES
ncbi:MAG: SRPBCC family protein [Flavobacteriales bacterium]